MKRICITANLSFVGENWEREYSGGYFMVARLSILRMVHSTLEL